MQELAAKTVDLCRRLGIRSATFYTWRSRRGGMEVFEVTRPKALEEEKAKLKRLYAKGPA